MKKLIIGIIIGLVLGGASVWLVLQRGDAATEPNPAGEEKHEAGLHLTKEQQVNAGLVVGKPQQAGWQAESRAFGRVLDAAPLVTLLAEIEAADSAAAMSAKEFERLKSLGENAAARTLESAEAVMKRDRAASESAHARLLAGWGKVLSNRADLASLARSLLAQEFALARVDVPAGETLNGTPTGVRIAPVAGNESFHSAELIGPAPSADPQSQGEAFLVLLREVAPKPGTALTARLADGGAMQKGFKLPRAAVVQQDSETFVFVQTGDETFERRRIETGPPQRDGVLVSSGLSEADRVVVAGAQQLLSEEFKGAGGGE